MKLSWNEIENRALKFSREWKNARDKKSQSQLFLSDFFHVFGVDLKKVALFESKVPMGDNRDGYAAKKMAALHDKLKENGYCGHNLEVYLIRLLYCMFADDSGIFEKGDFYHYIKNSSPDSSNLSERIAKLFNILDMNGEKRLENKLLSDEIKLRFPYIDGKIFRDNLSFDYFDSSMRNLILECCHLINLLNKRTSDQ